MACSGRGVIHVTSVADWRLPGNIFTAEHTFKIYLAPAAGAYKCSENNRHGEGGTNPDNPLLHFRYRDGTHKEFEACIDETRIRQQGGRHTPFLFFEQAFVVGGKQRV